MASMSRQMDSGLDFIRGCEKMPAPQLPRNCGFFLLETAPELR